MSKFNEDYENLSGYLEYKDFKKKYKFTEKSEKVGDGSYGDVYIASSSVDALQYVVKKHYGGKKFFNFVKEISIINSINHPNIVKIENWTVNGKRYYFSQRYGIPLYLLSEYSRNFDEEKMYRIYQGIYSAIKFLHSKNIVHMDIKPENMIYDEQDSQVKIIDFGISTYGYRYKNGLFTFRNKPGTDVYMDPEYSELTYNSALCDYYSMGISFLRMFLLSNKIIPSNIPKILYNTEMMEDIITYKYSEHIIKKQDKDFNTSSDLFNGKLYGSDIGDIQMRYERDMMLKNIIDECIKPYPPFDSTSVKDSGLYRKTEAELESYIETVGFIGVNLLEGKIEEPIMLKEPEYCNIAYTTIVNDVNVIINNPEFETLARTGFLTHHIIHRTLPILGQQYGKERKIPSKFILKLACSAFYLANCVYGKEFISFERIIEKAGFKVTVYDMITMTMELLKICEGVIASPTFWDYSESADALPLYLEAIMNCKYYPYQKMLVLPWDKNVSNFTNSCYINVGIQMLYGMNHILHYMKKVKGVDNKNFNMILDIMKNIENSDKDNKKEEYCKIYKVDDNCKDCEVLVRNIELIDPIQYLEQNFFDVLNDNKYSNIRDIYTFKESEEQKDYLTIDIKTLSVNDKDIQSLLNEKKDIYIPEENSYMIIHLNRVKDGVFDNKSEIEIKPSVNIGFEDYVLSGVISIGNKVKGNDKDLDLYYSVYDETGSYSNVNEKTIKFTRLYTSSEIYQYEDYLNKKLNINKNAYILLYTKKHDENYRYMFESEDVRTLLKMKNFNNEMSNLTFQNTNLNKIINPDDNIEDLNKLIDEIFIYDDAKLSEILEDSLKLKEKQMNQTLTENDKNSFLSKYNFDENILTESLGIN